MAHVQRKSAVRRDGSTRTWYRVRYLDPAGRERARDFERKKDADAFKDSQVAAMRRGEWVDPDAGRISVREWSERWLATKVRIKGRTRMSYASLLRTWMWPRLGDRELASLRRIDVEELVAAMVAAGRSPSQVGACYRLLSQMLKAAVANDVIPRNVADGVEIPRERRGERMFLTSPQVDALAEAIDPRYRAWVYVVAWGGLRFGEAAALRRHNCDVLRGRIYIADNVTEVTGQGLVVDTPKPHRAEAVRIPRFVAEILAEHLARQPDLDEAIAFPAPRGGMLRYRNFRRDVFDQAVARVGLVGLTPHELRHTCAALLIAAGADAKAIQTQMRHSSIQVTFDTYGHLFDGHLEGLFDTAEQLRADGGGRVIAFQRRAE